MSCSVVRRSVSGVSLLLFLFIPVFLSCTGGGKKIVDVEELHIQDSIDSANDTLHLIPEEPEPPKAVDELFDDFFYTFVNKPSFQVRRINFPLKCHEGEDVKDVNRSEWEQFDRFSSQELFSVIYEHDDDMQVQKDTAINRVSVEWIYLQDDYVETFTFRRFKSKWILMTIRISDIEDLPNGDFLKFYAQFVADSAFHSQSIHEPLKLTITDDAYDGEGVSDEQDTLLSVEDWMAMKEEYPIPQDVLVNIDYGQPNQSHSRKTLLMEGMSNGLFIKFKFHREDGGWKLTEIEN